jgi:uncharacterized Zn finger protein
MSELHYEHEDQPIKKAEFKAKVAQLIERRRAEGEALEAILPNAQKELSTSFWGQAWNRNLMAYADYESRMAPARTSLRKGEVLDLRITAGKITAVVAGLGLYDVTIHLKPLDEEVWQRLCTDCSGKVSSLVELLTGKLSSAVMQRVTDLEDGLFPSPSQIRSSCTCPDDARLCTHAAAVLYAVSIQLDSDPTLLFTLRQVHAQDMLQRPLAETVTGLVGSGKDDIAGEDLNSLFGIEPH